MKHNMKCNECKGRGTTPTFNKNQDRLKCTKCKGVGCLWIEKIEYISQKSKIY